MFDKENLEKSPKNEILEIIRYRLTTNLTTNLPPNFVGL